MDEDMDCALLRDQLLLLWCCSNPANKASFALSVPWLTPFTFYPFISGTLALPPLLSKCGTFEIVRRIVAVKASPKSTPADGCVAAATFMHAFLVLEISLFTTSSLSCWLVVGGWLILQCCNTFLVATAADVLAAISPPLSYPLIIWKRREISKRCIIWQQKSRQNFHLNVGCCC